MPVFGEVRIGERESEIRQTFQRGLLRRQGKLHVKRMQHLKRV